MKESELAGRAMGLFEALPKQTQSQLLYFMKCLKDEPSAKGRWTSFRGVVKITIEKSIDS